MRANSGARQAYDYCSSVNGVDKPCITLPDSRPCADIAPLFSATRTISGVLFYLARNRTIRSMNICYSKGVINWKHSPFRDIDCAITIERSTF